MMHPVTTVILAGGRGRRIGGNKAQQLLHGRPLIEWVLDIVRPQSEEILISANDQLADYASYGYRLVSDAIPGYAGPLAGLQSGLRFACNEWVACVPCDTPSLPQGLIARLAAEIGAADCAVAVAAGRRQPAVALYRKAVLPRLDRFLGLGGRKAGDWLDLLQLREVVFEQAESFANINTQEELNHFRAA